MATYAPNGTAGNADTAYTFSSGRSPNRYHLSRLLKKKNMQVHAEILSTLLEDSTPASTASVTRAEIDAVATPGGTNSQGGARTVTSNEKVDLLINSAASNASANTARAVTAADVTELQKEVIRTGSRAKRDPSTYPTDASGNGGGGKQDAGR